MDGTQYSWKSFVAVLFALIMLGDTEKIEKLHALSKP